MIDGRGDGRPGEPGPGPARDPGVGAGTGGGAGLAAVALLADGRFPSGGHAHSLGYEAATAAADLGTVAATESFLRGRLSTLGRTEAALVAALHRRIVHDDLDWWLVDDEIEARMPVPALRAQSRALGRQWLRAGRRIWDHPALDEVATAFPTGPHQVAAYATVAVAAGLDRRQALTVHLHHLVASIATAAVRLHGLDPFAVQALQWRLAPEIDRMAAEAAVSARWPLRQLPALTGPFPDVLADDHARWPSRLFQS